MAGYVTAVSLLKPPYGGFRSEATTWIQQWADIIVSKAEAMGVVIEIFTKYPRGRS